MIIRHANSLQGRIRVPGDKSISHRAAILAAMARGKTRIENFSTSGDCLATLDCLRKLGVSIDQTENTLTVLGVGPRGFQTPFEPLDCGNSGTTARLLVGLLAGQTFDSMLIGDRSLSTRPMDRIIQPLTRMGANILSDEGHLPLRISGGQQLVGIDHEMPVASAQVKSGLLLAGLLAKGRTSVTERVDTRDHTERMLDWFGVDVGAVETELGRTVSLAPEAELAARDIDVPGDISSAAFFVAAAACLPNSDLTVEEVGMNPTRTAFIDVLKEAGVHIDVLDQVELCNEPRGTLRCVCRSENHRPLSIKGDILPGLIDEVPVLAVLGTQIEGGLEIREAAELRHKESDRIGTVVENLRRMGAVVEEFSDGFAVKRSSLKGAVVDSFGDHRVSMAFTVAGLIADGETEVRGSACVDVSFPGFFDTLAAVVRYE